MSRLHTLLIGAIILAALAREANAGGPYTQVVLSPLIGDTLDVKERRTYDLLPGYADFRWAVFFRERDYTVSALVGSERNGASQETMVELRYTIAGLRQKIEQGHARNVATSYGMQELIPARERRGKRLVMQTLYGERVEAELLSVRDDALIVGSDEFISGSQHLDGIGYVRVIPSEELENIVIEGKSYKTAGTVVGAVAGALVGAVTTRSSRRSRTSFRGSSGEYLPFGMLALDTQLAGAALGAGIGGLLGHAVGSALSTEDVTVHPRHIWSLRPMARFNRVEPARFRGL
jgi:hypothetical protein